MVPKIKRLYELADLDGVNIPVEHTILKAEKEAMRKLFNLQEGVSWSTLAKQLN